MDETKTGRLSGKVLLVTGGGGAIGREIVIQFCLQGATVCFCDVLEAEGAQTVQEAEQKKPGATLKFTKVDLTNELEVKQWVDSSAAEFKKIDGLVNNAALFCFKAVEDTSVEDWLKILQVNVIGTATVSKYVIPHMKEKKSGSIVNIGSISSFIGQEKMAPYNTTKGAILQMTRCMALDLGPHNIRVNCVCPGFIETPATVKHAKSVGVPYDEFCQTAQKGWFLPRLGSTNDVAMAVIFLVSDESTFITGTPLVVDAFGGCYRSLVVWFGNFLSATLGQPFLAEPFKMDVDLSAMFPSDDPLDKPDFNITDWINKQFPNEESLEKIDDEMAQIKAMIKKLDEEIINEVSQHSRQGAKGQTALTDAKGAVAELFEKIKDIKQKSIEADRMVKEITADVGDLDIAKNNITVTIRTLTHLNNIVTKVEQIKQMVEARQYNDVAHSLSSVTELLKKFDEYQEIPKIIKLHQEVAQVKTELQTKLFQEFLHEISTLSAQEKKNLGSAATVIEILNIRDEFIRDFSEKQLSNYDMEFSKGAESAKLEHIDRRFTWLMNLLSNFHRDYASIFPSSWNVDEVLARRLCKKTKTAVSSIMKSQKDSLEVTVLKKALRKTIAFENELIKMFSAKDARRLETDTQAKQKYTGIISSLFDDFMYINTQQQDAQMNTVFNTAMADEKWEPNGKGTDAVLESSCIIVFHFGQVRRESRELTKGKGFLDLFLLFDKYLRRYAIELSKKLKSSEARIDDGSLELACVVLNTADYCCNACGDIETKMKEVIDPKYEEKVSIQKTVDEFETVVAACVEFLRKRIIGRLDAAFAAQAAMDWDAISSVGDQSPYITMIAKELNTVIPLIHLHIVPKHFANFCVTIVVNIITTFDAEIQKIRGVSELGGEQLLLDVKMMKTTLSKILGAGDGASQARVCKRVDQSMAPIEKTCQVILSDKEMIATTFKNVFPGAGPTEFVKILDIKGVKKADQESYLDLLGGVPRDAPIRLTIRNQAQEEDSMTGKFSTFLGSVSTKGLGAIKNL